MSNIDLKEFYRLEARMSLAPFFVDESFLKLLQCVVTNKENSPHVKVLEPTLVDCNSQNSQCRAVNICPANLAAIKNDASARGVENPIFVYELSSNSKYKYGLINGRHRCEAAKELKTTTPAVVLDYSTFVKISNIITEVQAILNDNKPSKSNNENDLKKQIRMMVERDKINLENDLQYKRLQKKLEFLYRGIDSKTIKNNMTRVKKAIKSERSDVFCAKSETFKKLYSENNIVNANELTKAVSTRGSSFDQEWPRSIRNKAIDPKAKITWIYSDNNNTGDSQTVINSRKSFFEKLYKTYIAFDNIYGKKVLPFDTLIISPQIKSDFTFFFNDVEVTSSAESVENQKSWKRISSKEILKIFHMKKAYIQDFIFTARASKAKSKTA